MAANFVDLTVKRGPSAFSDDEDGVAFGIDRSSRKLYKHKIWRLKQNDPNFGLLDLRGTEVSGEICARIGIYLWQSKHIKNVLLQSCGLTGSKMEYFFGKIAGQNEANDFVLKEDILGKLVANEKSLVNGIIESVASFPNLFNVNVSVNIFGTHGLDVLVKALAGSPIETLDISCCGLEGIDPLKGLRKCRRLKKIDISGNSVGVDDVSTVSMLLDNGYPRLRQLDLQSCGIGDDLIEIISPVLTKNTSLRYLIMHNLRAGERNNIGKRGFAALSKAVHDSSSFEKTLASNHTVFKINVEGNFDSCLFSVCLPNYLANYTERDRYCIAWKKHINHLIDNEGADMSPFMNLDIKLIPQLLARIKRRSFVEYDKIVLNAFYKIWACKMFRERIEIASRMDNLQAKNECLNAKVEELESVHAIDTKRNEQMEDDNSKLVAENESLQGQIAKLIARNATPRSKNNKPEMGTGSIAERVRKRKNTRKRGRKD
mmetsp:Transcript_11895/g.22004  ORF Transcript_11895/g.22004 Transcript_11895/m.22004 type:complete len:487 (-) Transcript_11895:112-1572(-)|eukprot:CAMPEP_0201870100 /NCGR_PEP_ID=MMETSP0902-20130614/3338_1 /ASSEMBLY_ACC=CAM_ASM_000551 /TAXON_ID=420261 /ORGANISM="Thalassiosira antarctica, Strain CCMP982" /LENGTH=486 /DNA_ID=CAMNT_0048395673 /DNA_START=164 /DNA_END=1624 /DNA_ORIENTATION=-